MKKKQGKFSAPRTGENQPEKPARKKPGRHLGWKELTLLAIPAAAIIVAVLVVLGAVDRGSTYVFRQEGHQYYGGSVTSFLPGASLQAKADGTVQVSQNGQTADIALPVYLEETSELLVTADMLYYAPRSGGQYRMLHFSQVGVNSNGNVSMSRDGSTTRLERGFLFDGQNVFVFLEPMTVSFNDRNVELPALSYVEAEYGGSIMIYNSETQECIMELSNGDATAQTPYGDYTIALEGDSLTVQDKGRELLVSRPSLVDPIS